MRIYIFLASTLLLLQGCATTLSLTSESVKGDCDKGKSIPYVYSGISTDIYSLSKASTDLWLPIIDMPFSLVADTLVLPYTITQQVISGDLCFVSKANEI